MAHKAGYITILGYPNVGKSTLMNAVVGEKLSGITPKAQTTRHRIIGILNDENFQMVFSDTPGILTPKYKLHQAMVSAISSSLSDADIILLVTEPGQKFTHEEILQRITTSDIPVIVLINKIDTIDQIKLEKEVDHWAKLLPKAEILPVSALHQSNLDLLKTRLVKLLPQHPPFYDKDELTDRNERFFVSEIIREKILMNYSQEIPYSVEVAIDSFKVDEALIRIRAIIFIARESQKAIILGHQGKSIKKLGTEARLSIEEFLGRHVFLELHVKVSKDWREDELQLKRFGYNLGEDKEL
ncbi:MAG: GTPase Era [Bacteroidetes bacterium]|nr:GTPase Era [Bacteroidota bacterium]